MSGTVAAGSVTLYPSFSITGYESSLTFALALGRGFQGLPVSHSPADSERRVSPTDMSLNWETQRTTARRCEVAIPPALPDFEHFLPIAALSRSAGC